jgi:YVTN family beta-propeller protein
MGYGAPYPRNVWRNHPGRFLHLAILRGDVAVAAPPEGSTPLGNERLAGKEGELFQAPPFSESRWGLYHGNHLIFRSRQNGSPYTISLHSWRRNQASRLLEKLIEGLRPATGLPVPHEPVPAPGLSRARFGEDLSAFAINGDTLWVAEYYVGVHRFDPDQGEIVGGPIRVKRFPNALAASEKAVWVIGATRSVDRIDVTEGQVRASIPLRGSPSAVAVGERYVWVASHDDGSLVRIDPRTNRVVGRPILVGGGPSRIAVSDEALWVTDFDGGRILRVDESTGRTVAEIPAGRGLSDIATSPKAIWVTNWDRDELLRVDPAANRVVARIPVGPAPAGVASDGSSVWVTDYWDGTVRHIDAATNKVTERIWGMEHPISVAAGPDRLVVLDVGAGSIVLIPLRRPAEQQGNAGPFRWVLVAGLVVGALAVLVIVGRRRRRRGAPGPGSLRIT